jgi:hypothetical protein
METPSRFIPRVADGTAMESRNPQRFGHTNGSGVVKSGEPLALGEPVLDQSFHSESRRRNGDRTELKYDFFEDIKRCDGCNEWIENKVYRLNRNNKTYYFHPFCFYCLTHKNPNYKSIYNSSILYKKE